MERLGIARERAPGETPGTATRRVETLRQLWTEVVAGREAERRDALRRLARLEGRARPRAG